MSQSERQDSVGSTRDGRSLTLSARPSSMHVDILYGHTVSPIIEGTLYLSDQQAPLDRELLNFLGVTHIVNASNEAVPNNFPDSFHYCNVNVNDDNTDDLFPHFDYVCSFLADREEGPSNAVADPAALKHELSDALGVAEEAVSAALEKLDMSNAVQAITAEAVSMAIEKTEHGIDSPDARSGGGGLSAEHAESPMQQPEYSRYEEAAEDNETVAMGAQTLHTIDGLPEEKVVLFHCWMGISRSATLLIAYLMKDRAMSLKDAFNLVKKKRPKIQPTPIFAEALAKYELLICPNLAANTITVKQMCGGTTPLSAMRVSAKRPADPSGAGDDDGTVSINSTPRSVRSATTLTPINEQENSGDIGAGRRKQGSCACCAIM